MFFLSLSHTFNDKDDVRSSSKGKKDELCDADSDLFVSGPERLFFVQSNIFSAMLHHRCTILFYSAVIKPIPKNISKSRANSSNYRAISLNPTISKILD